MGTLDFLDRGGRNLAALHRQPTASRLDALFAIVLSRECALNQPTQAQRESRRCTQGTESQNIVLVTVSLSGVNELAGGPKRQKKRSETVRWF